MMRIPLLLFPHLVDIYIADNTMIIFNKKDAALSEPCSPQFRCAALHQGTGVGDVDYHVLGFGAQRRFQSGKRLCIMNVR